MHKVNVCIRDTTLDFFLLCIRHVVYFRVLCSDFREKFHCIYAIEDNGATQMKRTVYIFLIFYVDFLHPGMK